jgi:hypothetical protein
VTLSLSGWWRCDFILKRALHGFVLERRSDFILEWLAAARLCPQVGGAVEGSAIAIGPSTACHGSPTTLGSDRPQTSRASDSPICPPPPSSCVDPNSSHRPPPLVEPSTVEGLAEGTWGPSRGPADRRWRLPCVKRQDDVLDLL